MPYIWLFHNLSVGSVTTIQFTILFTFGRQSFGYHISSDAREFGAFFLCERQRIVYYSVYGVRTFVASISTSTYARLSLWFKNAIMCLCCYVYNFCCFFFSFLVLLLLLLFAISTMCFEMAAAFSWSKIDAYAFLLERFHFHTEFSLSFSSAFSSLHSD